MCICISWYEIGWYGSWYRSYWWITHSIRIDPREPENRAKPASTSRAPFTSFQFTAALRRGSLNWPRTLA